MHPYNSDTENKNDFNDKNPSEDHNKILITRAKITNSSRSRRTSQTNLFECVQKFSKEAKRLEY